jgi:DNA polymerase-3 subunit delta
VVALAARDIESFPARPDPARPVILVHGPDAGLVRERADALIASAVDDPNDPFSLVRLEGDELASEPSRLVEEAMTVPLFGGRRAIRIKAGGRSFASGVDVLLREPPRDCRIVIEAGELRRDAPLRAMCEKAKTAAVIACFVDGVRDLNRLIDEELKLAGLTIAADARATLTALLGGDRQASRNEIRKLALYAHGSGEIGLADIAAIVTDASALAMDPIVDSAFAGRPAEVELTLGKAMAAGTSTGGVMFAAQRHAGLLHKASLAVATGQSIDSAMERAFPRLHFSRKDAVQTVLRNLSPERLLRFIEMLADATLEMRRRSALADVIAQRTLLAIAVNARRRG